MHTRSQHREDDRRHSQKNQPADLPPAFATLLGLYFALGFGITRSLR